VITEEEFKAEALAFLEANAKLRQEEQTAWGEGTDKVALFAEKTREEELAEVEESKKWRQQVFDAGFGWITGPSQYGGRELPSSYERLYQSLEARFDTPSGSPFGIGLGMVAPTILAHATDKVKDLYLRAMYRGEIVGCQLFSEPAAGSDLAGLQTRAVRDGDEWVLNGQKVWTSGAHYSDFGIVLVRTDVDAPKHKGLTMFWIDMKSPGIEVKPIHQMSGGSDFNEVYFTDVRVKDSQRLGPVNDGWRVALVTLMNERLAVGGASGPGPREILELARSTQGEEGSVLEDDAFRQKLADWYVQNEGLKLTRFRTQTALSRGETPGPESSIGKIIAANVMQDLASTALDMEDQYGIIADPKLAPLEAAFHMSFMSSPGLRIAGGTDEILKNIIAERVLGLPGDIRVDKDVPFKDMPTGR
jgi:alkylation response protein AidB-like acyl-CoA dehydrogenase